MTFTDLAGVQAREIVPGYHGKFVHTGNVTVGYWEIDAGASLSDHAHLHEQITSVIEGQFEMTVGGETRVLGPGMVAVIPAHVRHSGRAHTACRLVDVFYPVREDYR
jgi:quercetin dioxygenase-like cupin family protein